MIRSSSRSYTSQRPELPAFEQTLQSVSKCVLDPAFRVLGGISQPASYQSTWRNQKVSGGVSQPATKVLGGWWNLFWGSLATTLCVFHIGKASENFFYVFLLVQYNEMKMNNDTMTYNDNKGSKRTLHTSSGGSCCLKTSPLPSRACKE